ncbi:hypothetical protein H0E87_031699, partial [Populus deltoides]
MAKNKRNARRPPIHHQPINSVLALAAPPLPPPPPPTPLPPSPLSPAPPPLVVAGGSSPDKFLFLAEDESVLQQIVSSPSTPDHVFVEDCSDEDDYDEDEVDYSTSGGSSKFFRSPVPPSTGSNSAGTPHSASKASSLCDPGQSSRPVASPVTKGPSPVPAPQLNTPDLAVAEHNPPAVASSPAEAPNSGTSLSPAPAPAEKWRDLFASNRSTIT